MTIPTSMRCIDVREPGPPDVLQPGRCDVPAPREGEVLIEVAWAGVNRPDCLQRRGAYPPPPDANPRLGLEVSGRIAACGPGVDRWTPGDEVCALVAGGGYAEYCIAPAAWCLPLPPGVGVRDAAGLPETHFTVWNNLVDRGRLARGESVLVHGGTSGIGLTAIQVARLFDATVLATAGSDAKVAFCRTIGAHHAINYRTQDFVAEVERITDGRGVDVVLDIVGGDYLPRNLRCLALEGRLLLIAFLKSSRAELDFRQVMLRRMTITGSTLRASPAARKAELAASVERELWPRYADGRMRVVTHAVFPLDEAARAHALMESSQHIGKILLAVR
jgi:putative PIG3 family NAD(P)H quinone oxidoreductase